jgi:hypothetical protein
MLKEGQSSNRGSLLISGLQRRSPRLHSRCSDVNPGELMDLSHERKCFHTLCVNLVQRGRTWFNDAKYFDQYLASERRALLSFNVGEYVKLVIIIKFEKVTNNK